ncbi:MAG TPA: hypothetical protein VMH61_09255 [Candidatus Acidoferrales bacterium]|nr:hypothetical protein [Candidatus Acidoferrales bacterium]
MRLASILGLAILLLALGGAPSRPGARAANAGTSRAVGPTGVVLPAADPMLTEMQREIERGQHDYAALVQRLAQARDEQEAFGIEDEMRAQRTGTEIALLRIQSAYASRAGNAAFAAQLDRAIDALIGRNAPRPDAPQRDRGM